MPDKAISQKQRISEQKAYRQGYADGVEKTKSWNFDAVVQSDIDDARNDSRLDDCGVGHYYARGYLDAVEAYQEQYQRYLDGITARRAKGDYINPKYVGMRWGSYCRKWYLQVGLWSSEEIKLDGNNAPPRLVDDYLFTYRFGNQSQPVVTPQQQTEVSQSQPPLHYPKAKQPMLTRVDKIKLRPPDWLIRGLLEKDSLALIFGDSGCGKSFVAIDWACRIATGTLWRGHEVKSAPVVYIAGEGHQGFARRIKAWELFNGVSLAEKPFYRTAAIAIPDPLLVKQFIEEVTETTGKPALIVIDTLARNFGVGDENSTQDMTRFVAACDSIRKQYACTILIVHHTGHNEKNRARGAVALKAALDAEYRLEKKDHGHLLLTATKMKEAEEPPPLAMKLTSVELPDLIDDYGEPVTSAAIEVVDADVGAIVSQAKSKTRRGKWQKIGLQIAHRLIANRGDRGASISDWHEQCESLGMSKATRYRVLDRLSSQREIEVDENCIVLIESSQPV